MAGHGPIHGHAIAFRLDGEIGCIDGSKGLQELQLNAHLLIRLTLCNCHTTFANFIVTNPVVTRAYAR